MYVLGHPSLLNYACMLTERFELSIVQVPDVASMTAHDQHA